MDYSDLDYMDIPTDGFDQYIGSTKYKVTINADDETYIKTAETENKRLSAVSSSGRKGKRRISSVTEDRKIGTNASSKIGDLLYVFGERLLSNRPRLTKSANELFSEAYGLLQKMSIKARRGKKANLAAFFTIYIASKRLRLGVDPVLLAMDIGLTNKDIVAAIDEFIPDINTGNPLEIEILELIYKVDIMDIMEEYLERMWEWSRVPEKVDAQNVDLWREIRRLMEGMGYHAWSEENRRTLTALLNKTNEDGTPDKRIHVISPQKLYVVIMYDTIRRFMFANHPPSTGQEKHMQRLFTNLWGQIANNMEKTRKKTIGLP